MMRHSLALVGGEGKLDEGVLSTSHWSLTSAQPGRLPNIGSIVR